MNRKCSLTLGICGVVGMVMAILLGVFEVQPEIALPLLIGIPLAGGALAVYFQVRTTPAKQADD